MLVCLSLPKKVKQYWLIFSILVRNFLGVTIWVTGDLWQKWSWLSVSSFDLPCLENDPTMIVRCFANANPLILSSFILKLHVITGTVSVFRSNWYFLFIYLSLTRKKVSSSFIYVTNSSKVTKFFEWKKNSDLLFFFFFGWG
jgi:hypothetical protein